MSIKLGLSVSDCTCTFRHREAVYYASYKMNTFAIERILDLMDNLYDLVRLHKMLLRETVAIAHGRA